MLFAVKTTIRKMMMIKLGNYDCTYHTNSGVISVIISLEWNHIQLTQYRIDKEVFLFFRGEVFDKRPEFRRV